MNQGTIMTLVFIFCTVGVLLYIFFSTTDKKDGISRRERKFLRSEGTNSYLDGIDIYKNLHSSSDKAKFKGDHRRNA